MSGRSWTLEPYRGELRHDPICQSSIVPVRGLGCGVRGFCKWTVRVGRGCGAERGAEHRLHWGRRKGKSLNGPSTFSGPARVLARMGRSWVVHSGVESWVAASGAAQIVGPPTVSSISWQGRMSKGATFSHGTIAVGPVGQERAPTRLPRRQLMSEESAFRISAARRASTQRSRLSFEVWVASFPPLSLS